jgi:iron complex outermembrane recepter protein
MSTRGRRMHERVYTVWSAISPISRSLFLWLLSLPCLYAPPAWSADLERSVAFNIPAQSLESALIAFGQQAGVQVVIGPGVGRNVNAPAVSGELPAGAALTELLDATGLQYKEYGGTVTVVSPGAAYRGIREAGAPSSPSESPAPGKENPESTSDSGPTPPREVAGDTEKIREVVITGSHIHGVAVNASPVLEITRDDILTSGSATLADYVEKLPQNFAGGASPGTLDTPGRDNVLNLARGSGINLRGLGSDATLVLVDGRRTALSGEGSFSDIGMLPTNIIDRVEILADGASAVYGSDAVAGVANVILRKAIDGFETSVRYGGVTEGRLAEYQASQLGGLNWTAGNALIAYEYMDRNNLRAADRPFSAADQTGDLLPASIRQSIYGRIGQNFSDALRGDLSALYSIRSTTLYADQALFGDNRTDARVVESEVSGTLTATLPRDFQLSVSPQFSKNTLDANHTVTPTADSQAFGENDSFQTAGADINLDGSLISLPAGSVKIAVGGSYAHQEFTLDSSATASGMNLEKVDASRSISAQYLELSIPLVCPAFDIPAARSVILTVAGRHDRYSDFGSSSNPNVRIAWLPTDKLSLRGSFGRSFQAPRFVDLYGGGQSAYAYDPAAFGYPDPGSPTGHSLILGVVGSNPNLRPETATDWTGALEWKPAVNVDVGLDYFDIDFQSRIDQPSRVLFAPFQQYPLYEPFVIRNPNQAEVNSVLAIQPFVNAYGPFTAADVNAIYEDTLQNFSRLHVHGLDVHVDQMAQFGSVRVLTGVDGTYLIGYDQRFVPGAPAVDLANTVFNPARFKGRAKLGADVAAFSVTSFLNHTSSYTDNTFSPGRPIASWTTVDLSLQYKGENSDSVWLRGTTITASANNLFDRPPPYVASTALTEPIGYDPTNSDATGRFLALQLTHRW